MKIITSEPEITFDDILLLPNKSDFPMSDEYQKITLKTHVTKNIILDIPIVSAPMPGITETAMALAIGAAGGMGFIHCFQSFDNQLQQAQEVKQHHVKVAASILDLSQNGMLHIKNLLKIGVDLISVESAQAHNTQVLRFIREMKKKFRKIEISVGVAVTEEGVEDLIKAGADSIRVGIGGGSHCTTRLVTGVGRPQLSTIDRCYQITKRYHVPLISDTGIRYPGDVVKALAFGANVVMIGGLFSGTDECPGPIINKDNKKFKYSWGMCTNTAMKQKHPFNASLTETVKQIVKKLVGIKRPKTHNLFEEGVEGFVPYKGCVKDVLDNLTNGIRRSFWYQGSSNIETLQHRARAIRVSYATLAENAPRI